MSFEVVHEFDDDGRLCRILVEHETKSGKPALLLETYQNNPLHDSYMWVSISKHDLVDALMEEILKLKKP